jgi:LysM repeat protein
MKIAISFSLFFISLIATFASDSLRVENVNGKPLMVYRVEKGETLFGIARKYAISVNEIKALNPNLTQLKLGSEIYLPTKAPVETNAIATPIEKTKGSDDGEEQISHIVKSGDTFYNISKQYNVSVADLKEMNSETKGLKLGQELIIPSKKAIQNKQELTSTKIPISPKTEPQNKTEIKKSASGYPSITETCRAKLDESIDNESAYLIIHPSAIIGTLVLIKNKENGNSVHAKIISNAKNSELGLISINRKVFDKLESKTNIVSVEIFYTPEQ